MSKITSVETLVGGRVCIVRVRTDDGLEGIGQTAPNQPEISAEVIHRLVARHFLGTSPFDLGATVDRCVRGEYKFLGSFLMRALSGLDTAVWDLLGKITGQPVYQLLGGRFRDAVPVYASSMNRETTVAEEVTRLSHAVDTLGARAAKIKIAVRNGRDAERVSGRTRDLVPAMRSALGDDIEISADANGGFTPSEAIRFGRFLEDYDYFHFEEPNPCWELDNMGVVAAALDIPIGAGEQEFSLEIIRRMIDQRLVDIIQPDVCYVGGLHRARRVAEMAEVAGIPCTPHSSGRTMVQVFTTHLMTAMPACTYFQEWGIEEPGADGRIYQPMLAVHDGAVRLDDTPGWGVELTSEFIAGATRHLLTQDDLPTSAR